MIYIGNINTALLNNIRKRVPNRGQQPNRTDGWRQEIVSSVEGKVSLVLFSRHGDDSASGWYCGAEL
jgi:hypothetical protein